MSVFELKIVACDRVFYQGDCEALVFPGYDGQMEIMANHAPMITMIEIGEMQYRISEESDWQTVIVSDGLIEVDHNQVNVIVYSAERPDEIDTFRAEAAMERAKEQMRQKQSIREYHVSRASLARAMARLKSAGKYH
jgi:F-type H+-transporting ATPase subunit epsilon